MFTAGGLYLANPAPPIAFLVVQSANMGVLTEVGGGAILPVGGGSPTNPTYSILSGDASSHFQINSTTGAITPTAAGKTAGLSGSPYSLNVQLVCDETTVAAVTTVTGVPAAEHITPETATTLRSAAIARAVAAPTVDRRIMMRPGTYGTSGVLYAIQSQVMSGLVDHSNLDLDAIHADPTSYVYDDTAGMAGGSLVLEADGGDVVWVDRLQLNRSGGIIFDGVEIRGMLNGTPCLSISGTVDDHLGDYVFRNGSKLTDGTPGGQTATGLNLNGCRRVVVEDGTAVGLSESINDLNCAIFEQRRFDIYNFFNDAYSQRNNTIAVLGAIAKIELVQDTSVLAERSSGVSHADAAQFGSFFSQHPCRIWASKVVYGIRAQGLFITDVNNAMPIVVTGTAGGTFTALAPCTYGPSQEYIGEIRSIVDLGGDSYRLQITRGDIDVFSKGDFTIPFPSDSETITQGGVTATVSGSVTSPNIYSGTVENCIAYTNFGQGINTSNCEMFIRNCTTYKQSTLDITDGSTTTPNSLFIMGDELVAPVVANCIGARATNGISNANYVNHVDVDAEAETGPTSPGTVFDLSDKTFALDADGYMQTTVGYPVYTHTNPDALRTYLEGAYNSTDGGWTDAIDRTAPVLSSGTLTSVSTTLGEGKLVWVVGPAAAAPNIHQALIESVGWLDGLPVAASDGGIDAITTTGVQTPSVAPVVGAGESVYWYQLSNFGILSNIIEVAL